METVNGSGIEFDTEETKSSEDLATPSQPITGFNQQSTQGTISGHLVGPETANQSTSSEADHGALHFFLYLVSFLSLSFVATGVGTILFQVINNLFRTDVLRYEYSSFFSGYAIKYGIASILVGAPVYFSIVWLINKYLRIGSINENSKVRKWLTYIILFFASAVIIGDLIMLVFTFLDGDIVARFLLKTVAVLVIAASIFGYYFWDIRKKGMIGKGYKMNKIVAILAISAVSIVFIMAFLIVDSPFQARDKKIDDQILGDVQSLDNQVNSFFTNNKRLPQDIDELKGDSSYYSYRQIDPSITYGKKAGSLSYEICADFRRSNREMDNSGKGYTYGSYYDLSSPSSYAVMASEWKHDKGKYCFPREVKQAKNPGTQAFSEINRKLPQQTQKPAYFDVQTAMSSAGSVAVMCQKKGGIITSGNGGDPVCTGIVDPDTNFPHWPNVTSCGPNLEDTKWVVMSGENENYNFTVQCKNTSECNGPANAICSAQGCKFPATGTCDDSYIRDKYLNEY